MNDCVDFCMLQPLVTACEYNKVSKQEKCIAHTFAVGIHTSGDKNGLCSVIIPKGLLITFNPLQYGLFNKLTLMGGGIIAPLFYYNSLF